MKVSDILNALTKRKEEIFADLKLAISESNYSFTTEENPAKIVFYVGTFHFVFEAIMSLNDVNSMTIFKTYEIITSEGEPKYKLLSDMTIVNLISGRLYLNEKKKITVGEGMRIRDVWIHEIDNFKKDYWDCILDYVANKPPTNL